MANGDAIEKKLASLEERVDRLDAGNRALWAEIHRLTAERQREKDEKKRNALKKRQATLILLAVRDEEAELPRTVQPKHGPRSG